MPELPEVETIRQSLEGKLRNLSITKIDLYQPAVFLNEGQLALSGWEITGLRRRGKYLFLDLTDKANPAAGAMLMVHLRMTGKLLLRSTGILPSKHTHVRFYLSGPEKLCLDFEDVRRFGRIWLLPAFADRDHPAITKLGPEPLDGSWKLADFSRLVKKSKAPIKAVLLNQTVVAGIGNIYCDEALFRAKIAPDRMASSLSETEIEKLQAAVRFVLKEGIGHGGTSFSDYVDGLGKKGSFQQQLEVYQRAGKKCKICGSLISKQKIAGRGTHFCPKCQL